MSLLVVGDYKWLDKSLVKENLDVFSPLSKVDYDGYYYDDVHERITNSIELYCERED